MRIVNVSGDEPCEDPCVFYAILSLKELNNVAADQVFRAERGCWETESEAIQACIGDGPELAGHYIARIEIVAKTV